MDKSTLYGEKITQINNEVVVLTNEQGKKLYMQKADLAEALRSVMAVATNEKNGLMSKSLFNSLAGLTLNSPYLNNFDLNTLHDAVGAGLSFFSIPATALNRPPVHGVMLHAQRDVGTLVTNSQVISQLYFGANHRLFYRSATGNGSEIIYGDWREL